MDVKLSNGFFDLCVNVPDNSQYLCTVLSRLYEMGYKTVAINQYIEDNIFDSEKRKKKRNEQNETSLSLLPDPFKIDELIEQFKGKLLLLSRITFIFSDPIKTHTLGHCGNLKKYNLYAVVPKTQAALQFACTQLNADIITINASCTGLKLNKKLYIQAVERGLHFEIQYKELLNPETRKIAIHHSHLFHAYGKSKNVIISSGASKAIEIRNAYDIINLGSLLGLYEVKRRASILWQCKYLLLKAERRRYGKIFAVQLKNESIIQNDTNDIDDEDVYIKKS